ncbi:MAG TPA: hypothetical protein VER55_03775 [Ardenticatenaceae bacterium]|nr:hypothetical protein [Ardenticatenaceae bacterium]
MRAKVGLVLLLVGLAVAGCNPSPEAARSRNGGTGADIGNRDAEVEIHGRTDPSHWTPHVGQAIEETAE